MSRLMPPAAPAIGLLFTVMGLSLVASRDVAALFGISQRAARNLLTAWVDDGFVVIADPANKTRTYSLHADFTP